jgi:hypothetical protein
VADRLPKLLQILHPHEMEAHVRGEHARVQDVSEPLGVKVLSGLERLSAGLTRRNEEAEAMFSEKLNDEHAVHVLQDRLVVVDLRQRRFCVFLPSADSPLQRVRRTMKALLRPGCPTSCPIAATKIPNTS